MLCGDVIVMTDKVITRNNNNSREQIIQTINDVFECDILFLPCNESNKFGHVDNMIQYLDNNKILLTSDGDISSPYYQEIKKTLERKFEVIPLKYNVKKKHKRDWSYINFYK
jgi:agmatine/peptidylarginine deiminase